MRLRKNMFGPAYFGQQNDLELLESLGIALLPYFCHLFRSAIHLEARKKNIYIYSTDTISIKIRPFFLFYINKVFALLKERAVQGGKIILEISHVDRSCNSMQPHASDVRPVRIYRRSALLRCTLLSFHSSHALLFSSILLDF